MAILEEFGFGHLDGMTIAEAKVFLDQYPDDAVLDWVLPFHRDDEQYMKILHIPKEED